MAADFVRGLYRKGILCQSELEERLAAIDILQEGRLLPNQQLLEKTLPRGT